MTSCYVYAILPKRIGSPTDISGIHGEQLRIVTLRDLAAVVGDAPDQELTVTPELVSAYHTVITRLREVSPALPVRFGTVMADEESVAESLERHYQHLDADIRRLDGKVEFGVTVLWGDRLDETAQTDETESEPIESGQAYMRLRLAQYQRENRLKQMAEDVRSGVEAGLKRVVCDQVARVLPTSGIPYRGSFLVERPSSEEFVRAFEAIRSRHGDLRFLLVGPWPPYSFVSVTDEINAGMFGANST